MQTNTWRRVGGARRMVMIGFAIGLVIGALFGVMVMCLMILAGKGRDWE